MSDEKRQEFLDEYKELSERTGWTFGGTPSLVRNGNSWGISINMVPMQTGKEVASESKGKPKAKKKS